MSEISLYRKYRPQNFQNLVGQDHVRTTLINAAKRDNLSHAYLFCGPRGTGKTSTARLVAKLLNCEYLTDNFEPCNECEICESISTGRLIDIIEIDAASNRGIDEMRELKDRIDFAPTNAKTKVYIIDEVHMLTKEAFNALLKTLEEPPAHAYFILATTEVHKIPETIISRCQRFDFKRITEKTIMTRLSYIAQLEEIELEDGSIELIAHYVDGGMRDAIGLLEQLSADNKLSYEHVCKVLGMSDHESIERLYNMLLSGDTSKALEEAHNIHVQGHDMSQFLKSFLEYVRQRMLDVLNKKHNPEQAAWFLKAIEVFQEAAQQVRVTVIPQLPLEVAIIRLCEAGVEAPEKAEKVEKKLVEKTVKSPEKTEKKAVEEVIESSESKKEEAAKVIIDEPSPDDLEGLKEIPHEEAAPEEEKLELDLETVKKEMPRVLEHIKTPSTRRSLQTAKLKSVEGINIEFEFATEFHMSKVMDHDNSAEIELAFKEVFGSSVKLKASLKKVDLEPAVYSESEHQETAKAAEAMKTATSDTAAGKDMAEVALDMFGGELIEE